MKTINSKTKNAYALAVFTFILPNFLMCLLKVKKQKTVDLLLVVFPGR